MGAQAQWRVVLWSEPVVVSVDTDSITTHAARITARVMWDYAEPRSTRSPSTASYKSTYNSTYKSTYESTYKSMIGLMVFDCATASVGGAGGISYSGDDGAGTAVSEFAISPDDAPLTATRPGTLGRDLTNLVCARAKRDAAMRTPAAPPSPAS
jgi:hypothetical protein